MIRLAIILALSASPAFAQAPPAPPTAAAPPPAGCANPESRQLDFWVGEWDVTGTTGGAHAGHSVIEKLYGGCVIRENWRGTNMDGGSINTWDPAHKEWRQFWADGAAQVTDYHGSWMGDRMEFIADGIGASGKAYKIRLRFTPGADGSVRQTFDFSRDGQTWNNRIDLTYRRIKTKG